jgi:hypothetical protein
LTLVGACLEFELQPFIMDAPRLEPLSLATEWLMTHGALLSEKRNVLGESR